MTENKTDNKNKISAISLGPLFQIGFFMLFTIILAMGSGLFLMKHLGGGVFTFLITLLCFMTAGFYFLYKKIQKLDN